MLFYKKQIAVKGVKTMKAGKTKLIRKPKRPADNPPMPELSIEKLAQDIVNIRNELENYSANLRPLDRRRLSGVGVVTRGFIQTAFEQAAANSEWLPNDVPLDKFRNDYGRFAFFDNILIINKQVHDILWNITIQAADAAYKDALAFYSSVRDSATRGIETSKTIFDVLFPFFKKNKRAGAVPTQKEVKSDVNALLSGKRSGEVIVRNIKPKVISGSREVVDKSGE
jgi:hypothetical protein